MLTKRAKSHHKDQRKNQLFDDSTTDSYFNPDGSSRKHNETHDSLLKMPGLFVGFTPRSWDADCVQSPTSPLDFRIFRSFGNPFRHHSRTRNEGRNRSWNRDKVGLIGIIDSLKDETDELSKVVGSSDDKNINLLERNLSVRSLDFCSHAHLLPKGAAFSPEKQHIGSEKGVELLKLGPIRLSDIEHFEDYTCVRTHCSNPKVTHIFGDHIIECRNGDDKISEAFRPSDFLASISFLKFCYLCKKPLDGEDIHMYRGEKAFCSIACRSREMVFGKEMENRNNDSFEIAEKSTNGSETTSESLFFIGT